ncbi:acyl-CoA dehydrogenase [soil metagenome]
MTAQMDTAEVESAGEFTLSEDKVMLRDSARDYLAQTCDLETVRGWDEAGEFPMHVFREFGDMGWLGIPFPEEYGGTEGDEVDEALILSELGHALGPLASAFLISAMTCGKTIRDLGTPEQLQRWIPGICDGSIMFAYALTEPQAGSDAAAITTRAAHAENGWIITGEKVFCTGASLASHLLVMARVDTGSASDGGGVGMFVVETNQPGVTVSDIPKLGLHTTPSASIHFDTVVVPDGSALGEPGKAWGHVTSSLNRERLAISAMCTGMAQAAVDVAVKYASEREQFGVTIDSFDAIQQHLAEMLIQVEGARALMMHAAYLESKGASSTRVASTAKLKATDAAVNTARLGMQVMGGYGYTNEFPMQRFLRDSLVHPIAGGSNEIQRNIISDSLVRDGI